MVAPKSTNSCTRLQEAGVCYQGLADCTAIAPKWRFSSDCTQLFTMCKAHMISIFRWLFEIPDPFAAFAESQDKDSYDPTPTGASTLTAGSQGQADSGSHMLSRI